jgi:2-polyprenyl-3-methyl-5-hydroxy-6-metoxy-1,4-benzoquinol methylase
MGQPTPVDRALTRRYDSHTRTWVWEVVNSVTLHTLDEEVTEAEAQANSESVAAGWTQEEGDVAAAVGEWMLHQGYQFCSDWYLRLNQRRLEHLASLGLDLIKKKVLDIGAGTGAHVPFYVCRGCEVTIADGRVANLAVARSRFPHLEVLLLDVENPGDEIAGRRFDIIHCYGLLYHLQHPGQAIRFMAERCDTLILETFASAKDEVSANTSPRLVDGIESLDGTGCEPTRLWVMQELRSAFAHAYVTATQPWHEDFPMDWSAELVKHIQYPRAVFVASHKPIDNPALLTELPEQQPRH